MGIQITLVKHIHLVGIVLWNMRMTKLFPDNMAVFTFHQGIIVLCLALDLVNSTCSFLSSLAKAGDSWRYLVTVLLTYSEPLSEWNPRITNGKNSNICCSAGMRKLSLIFSTQAATSICVTASTWEIDTVFNFKLFFH